MINTQFVRAFFVAILSQDKLYFTVLSQNEYKQKQTNLRKSNTQLTHLQYKIKSNMKNIKGYTHTFWSPSKLGVAGLSPVFRSHFKALTNVGAFFISTVLVGFTPPHVNQDVNQMIVFQKVCKSFLFSSLQIYSFLIK